MKQIFKISQVSYLMLGVLLLVGCGQDTKQVGTKQPLSHSESVSILESFMSSGWRGCELGMEQGIREEDMLDGTAGFPYVDCRGVFDNSYPYEFTVLLHPQQSERVLLTQVEIRRGHQDSFYALLRYFLRLQGIEDEQQRFELRSLISGRIAANPKHSDFVTIAMLPDGRQIELAHNYPKSAFSTLRVKNF